MGCYEYCAYMCHGRLDVAAIYSDSWIWEASEGSAVLRVLGYLSLKRDCDLGSKIGENQSHV